ncbi:hypothetical protein Trydic_g15921 [Trypoxylus dichotomus]
MGRYKVGDIVIIRTVRKPTEVSTKFQKKYRGPLVATEVLRPGIYKITELKNTDKTRVYATTAHVSQKLWKQGEKENENEDGVGVEGNESESSIEELEVHGGQELVTEESSPEFQTQEEKNLEGSSNKDSCRNFQQTKKKVDYLANYNLEDEIPSRIAEC